MILLRHNWVRDVLVPLAGAVGRTRDVHMHQRAKAQPGRQKFIRYGPWVLRIAGLALLAVVLVRADLGQVSKTLQGANLPLILASVALTLPLIFIKTVRWQGILRSQLVQFRIWPAYVAYLGSLFIGLVTPGRLGEFVKAVHVSRECGTSHAKAFSSVLADRLFDLYLLLIVGAVALLASSAQAAAVLAVILVALIVILPLMFVLDERPFGWVMRLKPREPRVFRRGLSALTAWAAEVRNELRTLTGRRLLVAGALTVVAYLVFFSQCYLLARALDLEVGFIQVCYVIALASLVTLLPISISGLGTREAVIVAYLGTSGVSSEAALGFSLLVFLTFYVGGGLMGAVAWWLKPVPLRVAR